MNNRGFAIAFHKNRAGIPRPTTISWMNDELDIAEIGSGALKIALREFFFCGIANENADDFSFGNFAHHFAVDPADGIDFIRPIGLVVRPAKPGGFVLFPFCRHGKAEFRRRP